jgi:hypothetical protein
LSVVVRTPNATLRIQTLHAFVPFPFTALGWIVGDVRGTAKQLMDNGVRFERFEGVTRDDVGIWVTPAGAMVCWHKDPDGNVLSLTLFI